MRNHWLSLFILLVIVNTLIYSQECVKDNVDTCDQPSIVIRPVRGRLGNHFFGYIISLGISLTFDVKPIVTHETGVFIRRYFQRCRFPTGDQICGFEEHLAGFLAEIERLVAEFYDGKTGTKNTFLRDETGRMEVPRALAQKWPSTSAQFLASPKFWAPPNEPKFEQKCAYKWESFNQSLHLFHQKEWNRNRFIHMYMMQFEEEEKNRFMRSREFQQKFDEDIVLQDRFLAHGQGILIKVRGEHTAKLKAKHASKKKKAKTKPFLFVGIHCRRTDHIKFELEQNQVPLTLVYYVEAMDMFRAKFKKTNHVVFIFVSDDMDWGRLRLGKLKTFKDEIYFVGNNNGTDPDAIGNDLGLLVSCNHTIQSHGTYSYMAGLLAGGLRIIPDHFKAFRGKDVKIGDSLDKNPLENPLPRFYSLNSLV